MTPERYEQLQHHFAGLCDMTPPERAEALRRIGHEDPELHALLQSMLRSDADAGRTWRAALDGADGERLRRQLASPALTFPRPFGPYTLVGRIADGASGTVYRATQSMPRRSVALKVFFSMLPSEQLLHRFLSEIEFLGDLDHAGIARIYDAGYAEADGGPGAQPYFAMELIDGMPLVEAARHYELDRTERIHLMLLVCEAVQHAHARGVIHRDLKPDNILVVDTPAGPRPKILDFGVARAIAAETGGASRRTMAGQLIGTIDYMSPEQAAGDIREIDVRSDVYALGVILYELLAGRRPLDLEGWPLPDALRRIRHEPAAPLAAAAPGLPRDLVTIVHHALAKEKRSRYQAVADLAADLGRCLRDEPILATTPKRLDLLARFARRNKALIAGLAAVLLLLVTTVVGTSYGMVRAMRERDRAQRASAKYEEIVRFMQDAVFTSAAFATVDEWPREVQRDDVLRTMSAHLRRGDITEPEVIAAIEYVLGVGSQGLGRFEEAAARLQVAISRFEADGCCPFSLARAQYMLGMTSIIQGHFSAAEAILRQCAEPLRQNGPVGLPYYLGAQRALGAICARTGRYAEARTILEDALRLAEQWGDESRIESAPALAVELAQVAARAGRMHEVAPLRARALALAERHLRADSNERGHVHTMLGGLSWLAGEYPEALRQLRLALSIIETTRGRHSEAYVSVQNSIGVCLRDMGRLGEARIRLDEAAALADLMFTDIHPLCANIRINLAWTLYYEERLDEARAFADEALARRRRHGDSALTVAEALTLLARIDAADGRIEDAEVRALESLSIFESLLPAGDWQIAEARGVLGQCMAARGEHERAEPILAAAWDAVTAGRGENSMRSLDTLRRLIDHCEDAGDNERRARLVALHERVRQEHLAWAQAAEDLEIVYDESAPTADDVLITAPPGR